MPRSGATCSPGYSPTSTSISCSATFSRRRDPLGGAGPWWLIEGTAHYADELYESEMGYDAVGDHVDGLVSRLAVSRQSGTHDLRELEAFAGPRRDLAILGTQYLVARYGTPSSYVRFWEGAR